MMGPVIIHVVMWRVEDPTSERIDHFMMLLGSLEGNVTQLQSIEVGHNKARDSQAFDVVLITRFATWEDLEGYRTDPFHRDVAVQLGAMTAARAVVDFER
jgi:Stress responsive A/B Barrel Domain